MGKAGPSGVCFTDPSLMRLDKTRNIKSERAMARSSCGSRCMVFPSSLIKRAVIRQLLLLVLCAFHGDVTKQQRWRNSGLRKRCERVLYVLVVTRCDNV